MSYPIVDLFAGPGGWDLGLHLLDRGGDAVGLEHDADTCHTRHNAGLPTMRADVADYPIDAFGAIDGLIASPPCPDFSQAGLRAGIDGETGRLMHEVPRWVEALRPRWVACEQVPPALEWWQHFARGLEDLGYRTWAGVLNAADYGVPQTRRRAILLAHTDRQPQPPEPTHAKNPEPGLFGTLQPWVSMAAALGWADDAKAGFPRRDDRGTSEDGYRERDWRRGNEPAFGLTEKARSWTVNTGRDWKPGGTRDDAQKVPITEPAPAVDGKGRWHLERADSTRSLYIDEPAPTVCGHRAPSWSYRRPATTIAGDSRLWPPGHKVNAADRARLGESEANERYGDRAGTQAIRLGIPEALLLQTFPADYPLAGNRTSTFRQVGNAVPPLLAAHILNGLTGP